MPVFTQITTDYDVLVVIPASDATLVEPHQTCRT